MTAPNSGSPGNATSRDADTEYTDHTDPEQPGEPTERVDQELSRGGPAADYLDPSLHPGTEEGQA
jgi:hypothetical protein